MEKESEAHYPLVLVTWRDATTFYGWHTMAQVKMLEAKEIQTAGFLVKKEGEFIVVAASLGECEEHDGADAGDPLVIPMTWVMKVEKLALAASCTCEADEVVLGKDVTEIFAPKPLEEKPGDDALGRLLVLDEHLRRGGTYATWPGREFPYEESV